ncbi:MAG: glutathione S-transferase family protein [Oligoflexus sp.]
MKLYGSSKTRALRCMWMMEECEFDYEHVYLDPKNGEHRQGEYRNLIKNGKVPYLVDDDGLELFESSAICVYLAKKAGRTDLWPSNDLRQEVLAQQWLSFALQELDPYLWISFLHGQLLPEAHRVNEIVPYCLSYLQRSLRMVEKGLAERAFLLGEQMSVADILVGHCLMWSTAIDKALLSENLRHYVKRLRERPAFRKTIALP